VYSVSASGFNSVRGGINIRTSVPITLKIPLVVGTATASVTVTGAEEEIENDPKAHVDVDISATKRMTLSTPGNGLSDVVTKVAGGVAADSNGFFHPLGDHAQSQTSLDGTPDTDQQSKAFSTQLPVNVIGSMEVIIGATPAEYGDKDSLVINATSRSGLNEKKPTGSFTSSYGTFGTMSEEFAYAQGNAKFGNFTAVNFARSRRFLDPPESTVLHDLGTAASIFDRVDYLFNSKDTLHLNLFLARNQFQIPNQFDQQAVGQDQRQLIHTISIAPGFVHVFGPTAVLSINPYYRLDVVKYSPSSNPFADLPVTIGQQRRLNSVGLKAALSYVKGRNNAKFGVQLQRTYLTENFHFGITDPTFNDPADPTFLPGLLPFDLTRGGQQFIFHGHKVIKQEAFFGQDELTIAKNLHLSLGLRFDIYRGISQANSLQPRLGFSYLVKRTNTVVRGSYVRTFETPYNENLILSSSTGVGGLATGGGLGSISNQPLQPGRRNQFNFGFQQAVGSHVIIDADYFWKHTQNAYDFNSLLSTPITFPISWSLSKLDGVSVRANLTPYKNFSAFVVAGHNRARYFPPETGGLFFNSSLPGGVFRIDHDQAFQETTQVQYQFNQWKKVAPYVTFTWRYDSGLVAGSVPDFATALTLTGDQQQQIGLFCGNTFATLANPLTVCNSATRGALRVVIPADGTENDDTKPPRIAPRSLFDFSVGTDNLFRAERTKVTLRFSGINITNKIALYNFLSTFSGTHFVQPRAFQIQAGVTF
jgi:TonB dependent receptor